MNTCILEQARAAKPKALQVFRLLAPIDGVGLTMATGSRSTWNVLRNHPCPRMWTASRCGSRSSAGLANEDWDDLAEKNEKRRKKSNSKSAIFFRFSRLKREFVLRVIRAFNLKRRLNR